MSNKKRKFKNKDKDYITDPNRLMRLNKILGSKKFISILSVILYIIGFLIINYILVSIFKIYEIRDFSKLKNIVDLSNVVDFSYISNHYWLYAILIVLLTVFIIRFIIKTRFAFKDLNVGQKGVSRWTKLEEVQEQYKAIPDSKQSFDGKGGIPICRFEYKLYIDDTPVNNLLIGITRSGKGEMFVFPMIDIYSRAKEQSSLIVSDPKLELYKSSKQTLEKRGFDVFCLNLIEPLKGMGFNPLSLIIEAYENGRYSEAELLCSSFTSSIFQPDEANPETQYFATSSSSLVDAVILAQVDDLLTADKQENAERKKALIKGQEKYLALSPKEQMKIRKSFDIDDTDYFKYDVIPDYVEFRPTHKNKKKITMYSVVTTFLELATRIVDKYGTTALDEYFSNRPVGDRAKLKFYATKLAGDRQKGNVYSFAISKLTIFTYEEVAKMTAQSSVDLLKVGFGDKPIAIFIGIPDYDSSKDFIESVFISQLYFILAKNATNTKTGKCDREVIFLLDEFGNIPKISNLEKIATVCLGRNIKLNMVIQSYSQVEKIYGKEAANTIIGNCGNQIYIQTDDKDTAEHFSQLIGSETITNVTRMGGKISLNKSYTEIYDEKPLLNKNELMELQEGECVVKRVMKRTDLKGKSVKPTPIFNTGSTKFLYRYQYLIDDFPNRSGDDIDIKGNENVVLEDIRFDVEGYLKEKRFKQSSGFNEIEEYDIQDMPLFHHKNCNSILKVLEENNITNITKDSTLSEVELIIQNATNKSILTADVYEKIENLLSITDMIEMR